jgi:hypothetical protein
LWTLALTIVVHDYKLKAQGTRSGDAGVNRQQQLALLLLVVNKPLTDPAARCTAGNKHITLQRFEHKLHGWAQQFLVATTAAGQACAACGQSQMQDHLQVPAADASERNACAGS